MIYGSQIAFLVGVLSAFFAVFFGTLLGLVSGYFGGLTDTLLMRFTDIILVLPTLPIVLILTAIMGPNIWNIILIIALLGWPGIARVIRAQALSLKERPFIDAARVGGSSDTKIILKHIAPNVLPFTFLYMTLLVAGAIITEAALSFLGLGDPKSVTWGIMLSTIQTSGNTLTAWWWLLPPGIAITVLSLGFYLVGRAVDEIVNPRLRRR
jgi:peptide/nickel transport system permease protein